MDEHVRASDPFGEGYPHQRAPARIRRPQAQFEERPPRQEQRVLPGKRSFLFALTFEKGLEYAEPEGALLILKKPESLAQNKLSDFGKLRFSGVARYKW